MAPRLRRPRGLPQVGRAQHRPAHPRAASWTTWWRPSITRTTRYGGSTAPPRITGPSAACARAASRSPCSPAPATSRICRAVGRWRPWAGARSTACPPSPTSATEGSPSAGTSNSTGPKPSASSSLQGEGQPALVPRSPSRLRPQGQLLLGRPVHLPRRPLPAGERPHRPDTGRRTPQAQRHARARPPAPHPARTQRGEVDPRMGRRRRLRMRDAATGLCIETDANVPNDGLLGLGPLGLQWLPRPVLARGAGRREHLPAPQRPARPGLCVLPGHGPAGRQHRHRHCQHQPVRTRPRLPHPGQRGPGPVQGRRPSSSSGPATAGPTSISSASESSCATEPTPSRDSASPR